jgi:anti-sigma B factor antagonist
MNTMDFKIDASTGVGIGIATMPERLDSRNSRHLRDLFQQWQEQADLFVFDCSGLGFIDSSGLGALVTCLRKAIERKGDVRLSALTPRVAMVFELTRADRLFSMYPDVAGVLRSFARRETTEPAGA